MKVIDDIDSLKLLVTGVRNLRKGFITNFYLDEFKHNVWIQHRDMWYEIIGDTCFLIKKSADFWNVFYCSTTMDEFRNDLSQFKLNYPSDTMLFDIVGRDVQCAPMIDLFRDLGFKQYISLVRMNRMTALEEYSEDSSVVKASVDEVQKVFDLLHQYFDEKTEQIPYLEELQAYASKGHILVCYEERQMAGFLTYEMNATTLYLRYWFIHPDFRDKKAGSRLLRCFFKVGRNTKRQLLWVIRANEDAIKRYRHYGFKNENMYDYVVRIN